MLESAAAKFVFAFCKKYWKELLLVTLLFGVFAKSHADYKRLEAAYQTLQDSLKNQIVTLKELHADELQRRDEALKNYQDTIEELERRHKLELDELNDETQDRREDIVEEIVERKQFSENKEELAEKIQLTFGFEYVP